MEANNEVRPEPAATPQIPLPLQRLKEFYSTFTPESVTQLDAVYTQDVEFHDPVHTVHGSLALKNYLRRMASRLTHYKIRYLDEHYDSNMAFLSWEMDFGHPDLQGGRIITIRGMSQIKYTSKVYHHEDCYDLGALVYEHVPLLGKLTRLLKSRMARHTG